MTEDLGELHQRILVSLEECRQEIVDLLNVALVPSGQAEEIVAFENALKELFERELVRATLVDENTGNLIHVDPSEAHKNLAEALNPARYQYRESDRFWYPGERILISVALTNAGRAIAERLLDERGYEWWWAEDAAKQPWP